MYNIGGDTYVDYAATVRVQHSRTEIIEDLVEMLQVRCSMSFLWRCCLTCFSFPQDAFETWKRRFMQSAKTDVEPPPDRYLPRRIVFFRDGVSEGEFQTVFTQELGALKGQLNF